MIKVKIVIYYSKEQSIICKEFWKYNTIEKIYIKKNSKSLSAIEITYINGRDAQSEGEGVFP